MDLRTVVFFETKQFTKGANIATPQVGKWFKFPAINGYTAYGKVVKVDEDGFHAEVEKCFELPNYRPYSANKWYDRLPYAVSER